MNDNKNNSSMFLVGTLSFQASQQISSGDDISVIIDTIKCFIGKIGEKYSFKKTSYNKGNPQSPETTVNDVRKVQQQTRIIQLARSR